MQEKIAVIGLGYVGLPITTIFAKHFDNVVGFDINSKRIAELNSGKDHTNEVDDKTLRETTAKFTCNIKDLEGCTFFVVAVPTPIDKNNLPELTPVEAASRTVAKVLKKGDVVVYESTVYPGVTEHICGPILEKESGLKQSVDFKLGYSPERVNPGDKERTIDKIIKVVSGEDEATLRRVSAVYGQVIAAGIHKAPNIKVAEAAKVIENTQRDVNIALINELSMIFERIGIRTKDVLDAAGTKWNFLKFTPGLVGGHCIGVDPYYLTSHAESVGFTPNLILAGRKINTGMSEFVVSKLVKMMINNDIKIKNSKVAVLGLTFKENVPDLRNSRIPEIVKELEGYGINVLVTDPQANKAEAKAEYGIDLVDYKKLDKLDAVIVAVAHNEYRNLELVDIEKLVNKDGIVIDLKSIYDPKDAKKAYWSL